MIGSLIKRGDADAGALYSAQQAPTTFGALVGSAYDDAMWNNRYTSQMYAERQAMSKLFDPILQAREREDASFTRTGVTQQAQQYYSLKKSDALGGRFARNDREAQYAAMVESFKDTNTTLPTYADVEAESVAMAQQARSQFQSDQLHTVSQSPRMAAFIGNMGASFQDPVVLASVAGSVPLALTRNIAAAAGVEALIGGATEAVIQPQVQEWYRKQGQEYTDSDVAMNVVLGTVIGGAIGGAVAGGYRYFGGMNTRMFTGPMDLSHIRYQTPAAEAKWKTLNQDVVDSLRPQGYKDPFAGRTPEEMDPVSDNSLSSYSFEPVDTMWDNLSLTTRVLNLAGDIEGADISHAALASAFNNHLAATNPYRHTPTFGTEYDTVIYNASRTELDGMHQQNISDAIGALHAGEDILPTHSKTLSLELRIGQTTDHIFNVGQMVRDGVELTLKNAKYRKHLHTVISRWMSDHLNNIAAKVDLPADGQRAKVTAPKPPRTDTAKLKAKGSAYEAEATALTKDINKAKRANKTMEQKALGYEEDSPEYKQYLAWSKQNQTKVARMETKRAKLHAQAKDAPLQVAKIEEARRVYEEDAAKVNDINAGLNAVDDLVDLAAGKMPSRLLPTRQRLDEAYQKVKDIRAPEKFEAEVEAILGLNPLQRPGRRGTQYNPNMVTNPLDAADGKPIRNTGEIKAQREALQAEMDRLPPDMTFYIDGEQVTVKAQLDEFKALDEMDQNIDICAYGGEV